MQGDSPRNKQRLPSGCQVADHSCENVTLFHAPHAGETLTIKQLLDRIRHSVQGAFANSELPTGEQTVMAGLPEEDEPKLMPFGFAVHDESFFRVPEWHGLQASLQCRSA